MVIKISCECKHDNKTWEIKIVLGPHGEIEPLCTIGRNIKRMVQSLWEKGNSIHQCLFCCLVHQVIVTIFLNSIYMQQLFTHKYSEEMASLVAQLVKNLPDT